MHASRTRCIIYRRTVAARLTGTRCQQPGTGASARQTRSGCAGATMSCCGGGALARTPQRRGRRRSRPACGGSLSRYRFTSVPSLLGFCSRGNRRRLHACQGLDRQRRPCEDQLEPPAVLRAHLVQAVQLPTGAGMVVHVLGDQQHVATYFVLPLHPEVVDTEPRPQRPSRSIAGIAQAARVVAVDVSRDSQRVVQPTASASCRAAALEPVTPRVSGYVRHLALPAAPQRRRQVCARR